MDFERIQYLSEYIPTRSSYLPADVVDDRVERFVRCYKDLAFGYHFIKDLVKNEAKLPPDVGERALTDLYWYLKGNTVNKDVVFALGIHHPSNRMMENAVQAFLLTDATLKEIATQTGLSVDVLQTYEQLFFNVRARKSESLLIAQIVYPETRLVEATEGYLTSVDRGSFLKRAAYNNGLDDVAHFVGLKVSSVSDANTVNAKELASRLESTIMANGYYLARNGLVSQRGAHGVAAARGLILAAKQSGMDQGPDDDLGATSMGAALMEELVRVKGGEMTSRIEEMQKGIGRRPSEGVDDTPLDPIDEEALADE